MFICQAPASLYAYFNTKFHIFPQKCGTASFNYDGIDFAMVRAAAFILLRFRSLLKIQVNFYPLRLPAMCGSGLGFAPAGANPPVPLLTECPAGISAPWVFPASGKQVVAATTKPCPTPAHGGQPEQIKIHW